MVFKYSDCRIVYYLILCFFLFLIDMYVVNVGMDLVLLCFNFLLWCFWWVLLVGLLYFCYYLFILKNVMFCGRVVEFKVLGDEVLSGLWELLGVNEFV